MLKKLFGKKNEFALQLDESQEETTTETALPVEASIENAPTTTETATPVPAAVKVPAPEVPFWVTAMRKTEEIVKAEPKSEMTFSTDYLISSGSSSRRRPGPSLNAFKEIARQVKKPIS
jgi:hypothetical protein